MHGVKRTDVQLSAEERAARAEKIAKYNAAKTQILQMRSARQYDEASYALSARLIEINPDFYTLFNFRKEIVLHKLEQDPSSKASLFQSELDLSFKALLKNPKCYSAWQHRLWALQQGSTQLQEEMALCGKMLTMDARNFHCWNYRRQVAKFANTPAEEEFAYTTAKINENFSNYSAWHYRSVLIPRIYSNEWLAGGQGDERKTQYEQFLDSEFELVKQAFYTEPEDQSAWLYHRWLLGRETDAQTRQALQKAWGSFATIGAVLGAQQEEQAQSRQQEEAAAAVSLQRQLSVFTRELAAVDELLSIEPDCKWALLTRALLSAGLVACEQRMQHSADSATPPSSTTSSSSCARVAELTESLRQTFGRLIQLDPKRTGYYKDMWKTMHTEEKE